MILRDRNIEPVFNDIESKIIKEIDKATLSIRVAVAWFTSKSLIEKLIKKAAEGLQVDLIWSEEEKDSSKLSPLFHQNLLEAGGDSYTISKSGMAMMHNKFCIIDQKIVITGSYNWTNNGGRNSENIVIIRNQEVANIYTQNFIDLLEIAEVFPHSIETPNIFLSTSKFYVSPDEEFELRWIIKNSELQELNVEGEIKRKGSLKKSINNTQTFSITATKDGFTKSKSITVNVYNRPTISYSIKAKNIVTGKLEKMNPSRGGKYFIYEGQEVSLHWKIMDADKVIIDNQEVTQLKGSIGLSTNSSRTIFIEAKNHGLVNEKVFSLVVSQIPKLDKINISIPTNININASFDFLDVAVPTIPIIKDFTIPEKRIKIPSISELKANHIPIQIASIPKPIQISDEFEMPNLKRRFITRMQTIWRKNLEREKSLFQLLKDKIYPNEK